MTGPHPELITIRKQDLLEFVASIGFQIEEYQDQNLTHGFEISGYPNAGDVFLIDCASHSSAKESSDKVLDELLVQLEKMSNQDRTAYVPANIEKTMCERFIRMIKELRTKERE